MRRIRSHDAVFENRTRAVQGDTLMIQAEIGGGLERMTNEVCVGGEGERINGIGKDEEVRCM